MQEMPDLRSASYASTSVDPLALYQGAIANQMGVARGLGNIGQAQQLVDLIAKHNPPASKEPVIMANQTRLVQVFIADANENIPLDDRLLYRGEQKLTDLTDQELFFEIEIKALLDKHNEKRVKTVNKAVKERVEHLEPARIRDLKMTVVNIATF